MFVIGFKGTDKVHVKPVSYTHLYAVELMRYLDGSGMTNEDFQGACDMFKRCFIPVLDDFFSFTEPKNKAVGNRCV